MQTASNNNAKKSQIGKKSGGRGGWMGGEKGWMDGWLMGKVESNNVG